MALSYIFPLQSLYLFSWLGVWLLLGKERTWGYISANTARNLKVYPSCRFWGIGWAYFQIRKPVHVLCGQKGKEGKIVVKGFSLRDNILTTVSRNTDCCCYLGSSSWGWFRWWSQRSRRRAWYHGDCTTRGNQYTHPRDTHPTGRWISTRHAARQNNKPLCGTIVVVFA